MKSLMGKNPKSKNSTVNACLFGSSMKQIPREDQRAGYLWRKMVTNVNREGAKVTESLSDPDAIFSPTTDREESHLEKVLDHHTILKGSVKPLRCV